MTVGNVFVVGSFMMDLVVRSARRPRPGETVVGTEFEMFLGGKGFNQAVAAARCGVRTSILGRLGSDDFARRFLDQLAEDGIDTTYVATDAAGGTGVGAPLVDESGENSIVVVPRANLRVSPVDVHDATPGIAAADVLLLQLELPVEVNLAAARIAKRNGTTVVLNPAPAVSPDVLERFSGLVDVLVPNEHEAADLCGTASVTIPALHDLGARLRASAVVVTMGSRGCIVVSKDSVVSVAPHDVDAVDSVGAGDAFCGALGARLATGAPFLDAVEHANAAGAIAVTRRGAEPAMPRRDEIVELAERAAWAGSVVTPLRR